MSRQTIDASLRLTAVSTSTSLNCLQWTGDGQLILVTKSAVHILTPDIGTNSEASTTKNGPDTKNGPSSPRPVGWLRTMIGFDKTLVHHWPVDCQEWGSVSLGSLDPAFRGVAPSPSSFDAGCLLAVLNSNMELTIWGPVKNHVRGEWAKLIDITTAISADVELNEPTFVRTLRAQTTCIGWSPQAEFGLAPAPHVDGSLLAVGNRAGSVRFLRVCGDTQGAWEVRSVASVPVSDRWVTHVAWSSWTSPERGQCEAFVACGTTDGSVVIVKVIQYLKSNASAKGFLPDYDIEATFQIQSIKACETDYRGLTGARWLDVGGRAILICAKSGIIRLWSSLSPNGGWSGARVILLSGQELSVGSSALCPVSGAVYVPRKDALVVSLTDGSFHVIHSISTEPSITALCPDDGLATEEMSRTVRRCFLEVEPEGTSPKDVNRVYGMTSYDDCTTYVWIHESCQPTDFSYKHDAKHTSVLVVAQLTADYTDSELLHDLQKRISVAKAHTGEGPIAWLRPFFIHFRDPNRLSRMQTGLLGVLQHAPESGVTIDAQVVAYDDALTPEASYAFRKCLSTHIFGWDFLLSERLKLLMAEFCKEAVQEDATRQAFARLSSELLSVIWHHILHTIIRHITAALRLLSVSDIPFIRRIATRASLPGSSNSLQKEADDLLTKVKSVMPQSDQLPHGSLGITELCPACHAQISLEDIYRAVCPNGHVWVRCSITSFILATPMVRTCIGCGRKAFLPLSSTASDQHWLPDDIRNSWLGSEILEVARRCFSCGSNFVMLV